MSADARRPGPPPPLERLAHVRGSALAGRDLRDLVAYEERLLRLHVCTLHERRAPAPRVAHGVARAGELEWVAGAHHASALVDTRDGEFDDAPLYFASLAGGVMAVASLVGPLVHVDRPRRRSFTLRLTFAGRPPLPAQLLLATLLPSIRESTVRWIGVAPTRGCAADAASALAAPDLSTLDAWLGGHP